MNKKVEHATQKKQIYSLKHRELDNLRFEDLNENLDLLKNQNFRRNCSIAEKHIALSVMNTDKKQYLI